MKKILLGLLTLIVFILWDLRIRIKYIFSRKSVEKWVDRQFHRICGILFSLTSLFVNVHIRFERPDNMNLPETFMIITNHQSIQDIPLLIWSFPDHDLRFSAKGSLFRWIPMVSIMLRIQQHGRINRNGGAAETMKTLERVARKTRDGYCPVVFPEGTRSRDGKIGTFHTGAVRKMLETNPVPVVSVAIEGGWRVGTAKALIRNMSDFDYHVKLLEVFDAPESKKEIMYIMEKIETDITEQVYAWQEYDRCNPKIKKGRHIKPY